MIRLWLALAASAVITPAATIGGDVTPASPTAGSTLDLVGPSGDLQPGERADLLIKGLTLDEIKAAKAAGCFDLTVYPLAGVKVDASYDWLFDQLELDFQASRPGEYLVKLTLDRTPTINDPWEIAACVVTVAGGQDDGQDDTPPNPPHPPTPAGPRQLILVWESGEPTPATATAANSAELKQYLTNHKHHLWMTDQNGVGPDGKTAPAALAGYLARAKGKTLPHLFITAASSDGGSADILWEGQPPAPAAEWLDLIKKHGG